MRIPEDRVIMKLFLRNKLFSNTNRIVGGGLLFFYFVISINHWRGRLVGGYRLSSPFIASVYRFSSSNFVLGKTCTPGDEEKIKIDLIQVSNPNPSTNQKKRSTHKQTLALHIQIWIVEIDIRGIAGVVRIPRPCNTANLLPAATHWKYPEVRLFRQAACQWLWTFYCVDQPEVCVLDRKFHSEERVNFLHVLWRSIGNYK